MKTDKLLLELEELVKDAGYTVRKEEGSFHGDSCIKEGDKIVILNRRNPPEMQVGVFAGVLERMDLDDVYLKPAVRKELEELWKRKARFEQQELDSDQE